VTDLKKRTEEEMVETYRECARLLSDKKGAEIVFLDLRDVNSYLD